MRHLILVCVSILLIVGLASCNPGQSTINDLESLVIKVEREHETFTEEEWSEVSMTYSEIERVIANYEYSDEQLKEIGRLKGKYLGYQTQHSMNNMEKQIKNAAKEVEGAIEGFVDVFSNDNNN